MRCETQAGKGYCRFLYKGAITKDWQETNRLSNTNKASHPVRDSTTVNTHTKTERHEPQAAFESKKDALRTIVTDVALRQEMGGSSKENRVQPERSRGRGPHGRPAVA